MSDWISVDDGTPIQGDRVLLAIADENCPVVGYWGCDGYEACLVNVKADCEDMPCGGLIDSEFDSNDVTHWMPLPEPPK